MKENINSRFRKLLNSFSSNEVKLKNIKKVLVYEKDFMDVGSECDGAADGLQ